MKVGRVAWGGPTQAGWTVVNLDGVGCLQVRDWDSARAQAVEAFDAFELRRVDVALDVLDANGIDRVLDAHDEGGFNSGGRPPRLMLHTSPDPTVARKVTVGARSGSKYLRVYEKGKPSPEPSTRRRTAGDPFRGREDRADWVRFEVEFKAAGNVRLMPDMLVRRDAYFAGAYPYLAELLETDDVLRMARSPSAHALARLDELLARARQQYGAAIYTAQQVYGDEETLRRLALPRLVPRLVEAGLFLRDHDDERSSPA